MVPAAPAEKFFQRLRDDRGDRPSRRARMLPGRCGEPHGKPDSEDRVFFRDPDPARDRRLADITARLPFRAAQPPGQHPGRFRRGSPRFEQPGSRVDMPRILGSTRTATPRHDMKILQVMSPRGQKPPSRTPVPPAAPALPPAPRAIHDTTASTVHLSHPASQPAIRRPRTPSPIPASAPATTPASSPSGTNPHGAISADPAGPPGRTPVTGHPPHPGNPASHQNRNCLLRSGRDRDRLRESSGAAQPSKRPYVDKTRIVRESGRHVDGSRTDPTHRTQNRNHHARSCHLRSRRRAA